MGGNVSKALVYQSADGAERFGGGDAFGPPRYRCPHCRATTPLANYGALVFFKRGGGGPGFRLPAPHDGYFALASEEIGATRGDDYVAFFCTGCGAPVVAVFEWGSPARARVFEPDRWPV